MRIRVRYTRIMSMSRIILQVVIDTNGEVTKPGYVCDSISEIVWVGIQNTQCIADVDYENGTEIRTIETALLSVDGKGIGLSR